MKKEDRRAGGDRREKVIPVKPDRRKTARRSFKIMQQSSRNFVGWLLNDTPRKTTIDPFDDCSSVFVGDCRRGWTPEIEL